ncbi:hypothetical protein Trydic_g14847 [Trypoxylus dichotomus]
MRGSIVLVFLVCVALASLCKADKGCGLNMVFTTCGSQCPPTCGEDPLKPCIDSCYRGCTCEEGYMFKGDVCVLPSEC